MATTKTRNRKSKPETNGTPAPVQEEVPGVFLGNEPGREKVRYEKHWSDYHWRHRVEAHETLVPFREKLVEFLHALEDAGLIELIDYDVVEYDEENSQNWEAEKMEFLFKVTDGKKRELPNVTITLAAEGGR